MKRVTITVIIAAIFILSMSSCRKIEKELVRGQFSTAVKSSESKVIPVEEALESLKLFLEKEVSTKSEELSNQKYQISVVSVPNTKSSEFTDTLFYCVNFENEMGTAVLSANYVFDESIFFVTESGTITPEDIVNCFEYYLNRYNEDGMISFNDSLFVDFIDIIPALVCTRAIDELQDITFDPRRDEVDSGGGTSFSTVGPLLNTKWSQGAPFNYLLNGQNAGCVTIAAGQILAQQKRECSMLFDNTLCDWNSIGQIYNRYSQGNSSWNQVQHFIKELTNSCGVGSGTVFGAERVFHQMGLSSTEIAFALYEDSYLDRNNITRATSKITGGYPVFVAALDPYYYDECVGHAFVLDGYKKDGTGTYFHINWGWGGECDGYFARGIFDTTRKVASATIDINGTERNNFNLFRFYLFYD